MVASKAMCFDRCIQLLFVSIFHSSGGFIVNDSIRWIVYTLLHYPYYVVVGTLIKLKTNKRPEKYRAFPKVFVMIDDTYDKRIHVYTTFVSTIFTFKVRCFLNFSPQQFEQVKHFFAIRLLEHKPQIIS